jgi:UDP-N-acetylmuramate--alanine ligase
MKIHFVGIGGEGMSGLAKLALSQRHEVTGSDIAPKQSLKELETLGARIFREHKPEHIHGAQLVVRSSGIPLTHIELATALEFGVEVIKRSQCLGRLLGNTKQKIIRIAGSYGKSTTTAMLGSILSMTGLDPTIIVGANVPSFASHAIIGKGSYAVVEACEFDRSFLDIPGFASVITGIEPDHLDYYHGGLPEIVQAFICFADQSDKQDGILIACTDNRNVRELFLPIYTGPVQTYGLVSGDWRAEILETTAHHGWNDFVVTHHGILFGTFRMPLPGIHYVQNALAAIAIANYLGVNREVISDGLRYYKGVSRRYEKIVDRDDFNIIDDYGHTPIEIKAVIGAVREEFPKGFLLCIPCLRQFHRTKHLLKEFAGVFALTDACIVAPIVSGLGDDSSTLNFVTSENLASEIRSYGTDATSGSTDKEIVVKATEILSKAGRTPKIVLTIGSGVSSGVIALLK